MAIFRLKERTCESSLNDTKFPQKRSRGPGPAGIALPRRWCIL